MQYATYSASSSSAAIAALTAHTATVPAGSVFMAQTMWGDIEMTNVSVLPNLVIRMFSVTDPTDSNHGHVLNLTMPASAYSAGRPDWLSFHLNTTLYLAGGDPLAFIASTNDLAATLTSVTVNIAGTLITP